MTDVTTTVETAKKQQPKQAKKQADSTKKNNNNNTNDNNNNNDNNNTNKKYENYDKATASQFEKDDEEIALLEQKLNISSSKQKQKLHKEYAKLEGYGDDFGDFLDSLDHMGDDIDGDDDDGKYGDDDDNDDDDNDDDNDDYDDEEYDKEENMNHKDNDENFKNEDDNNDEIISMKPPATTSSSTIEDEDEYGDEDDNKNSSSDEEDDNEEDDEEEEEEDPDFDEVHTYTPVVGEDLYGNKVDLNLNQDTKNAKYIPPHLRNKNIPNNSSKKEEQQLNLNKVIDPNRQHDLITIQRLLTNNLNRLSDETLESVTKSISSLHSSYPSQDVNDMYWSNIKSVCVTSYSVMTSLIPTYTACAAGVDYLVGGAGVHHFGCHLVEHIVLNLWDTLNEQRNVQKQQQHDTTTTTTTTTTIDDTTDIPANNNKEGSNLMLILCYLYNYNVIPCTIIYDIIRDMILHFTEIDIEILLLILTHCGYQLRCDDPVALKDIVLLVQERALRINNNNNNDDDDDDDDNNSTCCSSSRVRYMVSAITDLKNNKRTKTNISLGEKSSYYRKAIGRIKSTAKSEGKSTDSALHTITLQDILNIKTKGRWWKVGASWSGSQFHDDNKRGSSSSSSSRSNANRDVGDDVMDVVNNANDDIGQLDDEQQELLVVLASQNRMNSDIRRKIFCIVMGSDDISHAFEKLIRANLLKGRMERDVMRVIVDCCSQENAYNPYYAHLICRICEYQPRCKFTLQLTFWDYFKQFETMNERKVANLAKLLSHLLRAGPINLNVLKVIEMDLDEDMHNSILLFLTILFTHLFDNYNNSEEVSNLFRKGVLKECHHQSLDDGKTSSDNCDDDNDNNDNDKGEEGEILRGNLSLFLIQYIKFSPKNVTKSNFHKNYKAATKACDMDGFD